MSEYDDLCNPVPYPASCEDAYSRQRKAAVAIRALEARAADLHETGEFLLRAANGWKERALTAEARVKELEAKLAAIGEAMRGRNERETDRGIYINSRARIF